MSIKTYKNGSWQDVSSVKSYKNGAWQDVNRGKVYRNGSWQEVYPTLPKLNNSNDAFYLFKNKIVNTYSGISVSIGSGCTILNDCIGLPTSTNYIGSGIQISKTEGYVWRHKNVFVYTKGYGSISYGANGGGITTPQSITIANGYYYCPIWGMSGFSQGYVPIIGSNQYNITYVYAIIGTDSSSLPWDGITGL